MDSQKTQRWLIGKIKIIKLMEVQIGPVGASFFYPDVTLEQIHKHAWLKPHFVLDDGQILGSVHTFIIEAKDRRLLVDTCVGNDKARVLPEWNMMQNSFLADLQELGYPPESIDTVMCTHLHVDHVGWNTKLIDGKWVPTFPRARYLFSRREWDHWTSEGVSQITPDDALSDSIRPVVDAGRAQLVDMDHRVTDEIWFEPTPGHSPGHVSIHIASQGEEAIITGDMMHHPLQVAEPELVSHFCSDKQLARATRKAFLKQYQDRPVLILGTHFAAPTGGHIVRDGDQWRFKV